MVILKNVYIKLDRVELKIENDLIDFLIVFLDGMKTERKHKVDNSNKKLSSLFICYY